MTDHARAFSRRGLLRGAGLLGAGVGLSACGSTVASGVTGAGDAPDTLTYWNLFSGGDGTRMVAMEDAYTKAHPDIDLSSVTLTWGNPYYTKLSLATVGKRPPDVAISHLTRARTLARAGLLEPLDEAELARHGMTKDKFTPSAWEHAHFDGKLYAIPLDTHPFVLFYRTDICKKAGLLGKDGLLKPIDGPEGMLDAFKATAKVTGGPGAVMPITADPSTCWRIFNSLYGQQGGQVLADNGTKLVIDDDKAVATLQFLRKLTSTGLLPGANDYNGATAAFAAGKAGFYLNGEWEITTFQTAKSPFSMTRFPHVFDGKYACFADSHTFVLPKNPSADADRRNLSLSFVRYMLGQSIIWAQGGHIPAWLPIQDSQKYHDLKPQADYANAAEGARYDPDGWYSGSGSDFENITGFSTQAVLAGQKSPAAGLKQMRSKLETYVKTRSPI